MDCRLNFRRVDHCDLLYDTLCTQVPQIISLGIKPIHSIVDWQAAYEFLTELDTVYKFGPYIVAYHVAMPWYSQEEVLSELIVIRYSNGPGQLSDVTEFLEAKAREHGCRFVAVGTFLSPRDASLAASYSRCGYTVAGTQLTKEIS